jgi:multiple sugar transport system substrate-binding protein
MAITWPSAADGSDKIVRPASVAFASLPGSRRSYNVISKTWESHKQDQIKSVPLAPVSGLIGVVPASSTQQNEAFRLLAWLSGPKWGTRIATKSDDTTLYRRSQMANSADWVEAGLEPSAAKQYAAVVQDALSSDTWVEAIRIPGSKQYYAALNEAVSKALRGEQSPADALHDAAEAWREISERLGVDQQRKAYRRSLGIDK